MFNGKIITFEDSDLYICYWEIQANGFKVCSDKYHFCGRKKEYMEEVEKKAKAVAAELGLEVNWKKDQV